MAPRTEDPRPDDPVAQVVVVCHANIARSPLAMVLLEAEAIRRLGTGHDVWIRSAGVQARPGLAAAEGSRRQAEQRGLDLSTHRSQLLTDDDVATADLVVTMTEAQRARAVRLHPAATAWTFTLPELARLCRSLERPGPSATEPVRERLRRVVDQAAAMRPYATRHSGPEDVADPYGGPAEWFVTTAELIEAEVATIADALLGPRP